MTTEATDVAAGDVAQPSQIIENREGDPNAVGRGAQLPQAQEPEKEEKPLTGRAAIEKAVADVKAQGEAKDEKAKPEDDLKAEKAGKDEQLKADEKPEQNKADKATDKPRDGEEPAKATNRAESDKSAADKPAAERAGQEDRQSEGRKYSEPPARFLPEARTKWANVPNEVKAEVHRVTESFEREFERVRPAVEAYESVREYDEMAKSSGTTMKDAMRNYVEIDKLLHSNPAQGIARVLQAVNITPQQLAQAIAKNPQAFQLAPQQPSPQQQQLSPQAQRLAEENEQMRQELLAAKAEPVIRNFAEQHPDYWDLERDIADILQSGLIQKKYGSLPPEQKLAEAYRMAGGRGPASQSAPEPAPRTLAPTARPDTDPDGQKSIRGAPGNAQSGEPRRKFKSNRDALSAAMQAHGFR